MWIDRCLRTRPNPSYLRSSSRPRRFCPVLWRKGEYGKALNALVQMKPAIDGFFEGCWSMPRMSG